MKQPRIVILVAYFGRWPFWMDFYLETLRRNPDVHWRFYTDCGVPANAPDNATFIEVPYEDYQAEVCRKLDVQFDPSKFYKLCDIKPAYGYLHADEIQGYDYWAFADIDVVYGDLLSYLTPEMLDHHLISFHGRRVSGHLCLIANTDFGREAFMQVPDWQGYFENPAHTSFDEKAFSELFMRHKNWPAWLRRLVYRGNPYMRGAYFHESYNTSFARIPWEDGSYDFPTRWEWRDGELSCNKPTQRQFPYMHFIEWKKLWANRPESDLVRGDLSRISGGFEVTEDGFRVLD